MPRSLLRACLVFCLFLLPALTLGTHHGLAATTQPGTAAQTGANAPFFITDVTESVSDKTLNDMGSALRDIYSSNLLSNPGSQSADNLTKLLQRASALVTQSDALIARIKPYQAVYQNFLDILGPLPAKDAAPEAPAIAEQRALLTRQQQDISARITRLKLYQVEAQQLVSELRQHGSAIKQATLWQRFPAPLGMNFWSGLAASFPQDSARMHTLARQAVALASVALTGKRVFITLGGFVVACIMLALWFASHRPVRRLALRFLPDGPIRPIAATTLRVSIATLAYALSFQAVWAVLSFDNPAAEGDLAVLADMVSTQFPLCGFVIELGLCLLSSRSEWRIIPMEDETARRLRLFPTWLAFAMIARGCLRYMDTHSGLSLLCVQFFDGLYTLAVSPLLFAIPRQLHLASGEDSNYPPLALFLRNTAMGVAIACWVAVLSGYIPLAYSVISWLAIMSISLSGLVLFSLLTSTMDHALFPARAPLGRKLLALGLPARLINQACVVIPGLVNILLLVVACAVATSGVNFDPTQILAQLHFFFHGQNDSDGSGFSLDAVLLCIGIPIVGYYAIKVIKAWFSEKFFPTTRLDTGAQASVLGILGYTAWILIGLGMLSVLGVTVQSMTWVVSALSVGIGFGLQSIVQNFVSGIILLAERPVSVGDVVTIAGITGKVERISVRSTDIKLDDKSTMIVPNSQFITSAVKNATLAQKPGVFTVEFALPFASDIHKAMAVMTSTLDTCDAVNANVTPTVSMTAVSDGSAILTGTATACEGLDIKIARNAALFALWQAFQDNNITITVKQTVS